MSILRLEGLVKRHGRVAALDGASLDVCPGELTVVLGPPDAGKTTLARIVAGLEEPDEGEVYIDRKLVVGLPPGRRNVGLVPQEESLWPHLTVAENVRLGLLARGTERRERGRKVLVTLSKLGIEGLADRHPMDLSPIQRKRAELARAAVLDPDIFLLDEPLSRLDPRSRSELREDLRRLHAEGDRSVLVFTSETRDALALADRLAVMDLGRVVQVGPPREVYERPTSLFVAQFLGPTNLLQGQIESADPVLPDHLLVRTPLGSLSGFPGAHGGALPVGTPVTLSIRPESIRPDHGPVATANCLPVTLEQIIFQGETMRLSLRGPGDWPITSVCLREPAARWREGQSLTVQISPENLIILSGRYATASA